MTITATQFRRQLFEMLERALKGETVEITHHGRSFQLVPKERQSKLARLVKHDVLVGSLEEVETALDGIGRESAALWERKWKERL
jgi:prevent-host-death family protein